MFVGRVIVRVDFGAVETVSQRAGPGDDHLVAMIRCQITLGRQQADTYAIVKQIKGTSFSDTDNIDVSPPVKYCGPLDYNKFAAAGATHYKKTVARAFPMAPGGGVTNMGCRFYLVDTTIWMECDDSGGGW